MKTQYELQKKLKDGRYVVIDTKTGKARKVKTKETATKLVGEFKGTKEYKRRWDK